MVKTRGDRLDDSPQKETNIRALNVFSLGIYLLDVHEWNF